MFMDYTNYINAAQAEKFAKRLSSMIKFKTVEGHHTEFLKFEMFLHSTYKNIAKNCSFEKLESRAFVWHWKGGSESDSRDENRAVVLMSHYDVVPADEEGWEYPPFSGEIASGYVWGRGTLDTKGTLCGIMEAADSLIGTGFTPRSDIYLCFAGDEETASKGAHLVVEWLKQRGIRPLLVLDEGGAYMKIAPTLKTDVCMVGVTEKGIMNLDFISRGPGGHSSMIAKTNPALVISEVVRRIDSRTFKMKITEPVRQMFSAVKPIMKPFHKIAATAATFKPVLRLLTPLLRRYGGMLASVLQTVGHITMLSASEAHNVIPEKAVATGNFRILPESTCEETLALIRKKLRGLPVEIAVKTMEDPSPISPACGFGYEALAEAARETFGNVTVVPFIMTGATDSSSYAAVSDYIYRFSPVNMTGVLKTIHGNNERVGVDDFYKTVMFYISLIKKL